MSQLRVTTLNNASNATGTANLTLDDKANATVGNTLVMGSSFKRNKIINGDMRVDQRNAGASGTAIGYTVDRWQFTASLSTKGTWQQNAGSLTGTNLPLGFTNYLGFTSNSAYSVAAGDYFTFQQPIEGLNIYDLAWGTANAKTITISFWVRSSLTGTFGGALQNSGSSRCYPFNYTISSANTWEQKSVTIAGDTTGTWLTTNGVGLNVFFGLACGTTYAGPAGAWSSTVYISASGSQSIVGTNGATFYITGVQLEVGSVATPYERQIYSDQLAQCQRYYWRQSAGSAFDYYGQANNASTTQCYMIAYNPVIMRATPTASEISAANTWQVTGGLVPTTVVLNTYGTKMCSLQLTVSSGLVNGGCVTVYANNTTSTYLGISAEL